MKELTQKEMIEINGGLNQTAYDAGHAVGEFIEKVVDGVLTLVGIKALFCI